MNSAIKIKKQLQIELHPADKVVSMVSHQGYIVVVTAQGVVYTITARDAP